LYRLKICPLTRISPSLSATLSKLSPRMQKRTRHWELSRMPHGMVA
jgi:hypothetical protein